MTERKILYRGFHPDENGKTMITLNGGKISGEWVYWNEWGQLVDSNTMEISPYDSPCYNGNIWLHYVHMLEIVHDTVGRWVTTDRYKRDVFEGDEAIAWKGYKAFQGIVTYIEKEGLYALVNDTGYYRFYDSWIELIGNKWESEVTE